MSRSLKKGPFIDLKLETKILSINEGKLKRRNQNLEPQEHNFSRFCWPYTCSAQW